MPLRVEHLRLDTVKGGNGTFTPAARMIITPALRTSGLLSALPDREARTLLRLLTFLTPNGRIQLTLPEVAEGIGISEREADERLKQLASLRWQDEPVVHVLVRESGIGYVTFSRSVLTEKQAPEPPTSTDAERLLPYRPANRETIVDWSRTQYAHPRDQVERQVLEQLGHGMDEGGDTPEGEAKRRLLKLGVPAEQADLLLAHHSVDEITDQLDWLPLREAKHPARFIVAAIQGKYDLPARIRLQRAIAVEEEKEKEAERQITGRGEWNEQVGALEGLLLPIPEAAEEPVPREEAVAEANE